MRLCDDERDDKQELLITLLGKAVRVTNANNIDSNLRGGRFATEFQQHQRLYGNNI